MNKNRFTPNATMLNTLRDAGTVDFIHFGERVFVTPATNLPDGSPYSHYATSKSGLEIAVNSEEFITDAEDRALVPGFAKNDAHKFLQELESVYWHIGELSKTRRFPSRQRFTARVGALLWKFDYRVPSRVTKAAIAAAYRFRWVNTGCLEWFGVDRYHRLIDR
jgi:hypothetical protein